jgi:hypothetical protein
LLWAAVVGHGVFGVAVEGEAAGAVQREPRDVEACYDVAGDRVGRGRRGRDGDETFHIL